MKTSIRSTRTAGGWTGRKVIIAVTALLAIALATPREILRAQAVATPTVQLAFGYRCDDVFTVRNEGAAAVTVAYAVVGTKQAGVLQLQPTQAADVTSTTAN